MILYASPKTLPDARLRLRWRKGPGCYNAKGMMKADEMKPPKLHA